MCKGGVAAIVSSVHKLDALSVVSDCIRTSAIFLQFNVTNQNQSRTLKHFLPLRFQNTIFMVKLFVFTSPLIAIKLQNCSSIDDAQRIPILSVPGGRKDVGVNGKNGQILSSIM